MARVPIRLELENCTANIESEMIDGTLEEGTYQVIIYANKGYWFKNSYGQYTDATKQSKLIYPSYSDDTVTNPFTFKVDASFNGHVIKMSAVAKARVPVTLELENCTANIESEMIDGTLEEGRHEVILYANEGYEFTQIGRYEDGSRETKFIYPSDTDNTVTEPFTLILNPNFSGNKIMMTATRKAEKLTTFVNLYSVDNDILTELSKVRFMNSDLTGLIDYGTFITNLTQLDFSLPDDLIDEEGRNIILGNYDTGVNSPQLMQHQYEMFLGEIDVPQKYHNAYDYINTTCRLHVPYLDVIELPAEYVVGYKIGITYYIDLYSCEFTMNVTSSFTEGIIHSENGRMGIDIPFIQRQTNGIVNQLSPNIRNNIRKPYIEVIRNIPYDVETDFGKESLDYGKLINFSGYIEVENVLLNTSATNEEKSRIITQLRNGVVIK